ALYTYWKRTAPYPSLLAFDAPSREVCVAMRIETNTPLQALVTLNDPVQVEAAQALARQMVRGGGELPGQIAAAYRRAFQRDPDEADLRNLLALYDSAAAGYRADPALLAAAVQPYRPYDPEPGAGADPAEAEHPIFAAPVEDSLRVAA